MRPEQHRYGRHRSQVADLYRPERADAPPVAVVVHGGFWRARYGRRLERAVCRDLAGRGWAAWNVEYRRLGAFAGGGYPATLEDVGHAIDHLAELDGLDLTRVVAIGHSAGGHLAAWAATREDPRVALTGVVAQAGVLDLRHASELGLGGGVVHRLMGGPPSQRADAYAAASPAERLPLGVPALVVQGGGDDVVPPVVAERFAAAARAKGDEVELVVLDGEGHFGHLRPRNPLWGAVVRWLEARG